MLWDSIYEFFVIHVFGGWLTGTPDNIAFRQYRGLMSIVSNDAHFTTDNFITLYGVDFTLGNYLSLIATIITMFIIVTLCALFIWKIIKLVGGLIR